MAGKFHDDRIDFFRGLALLFIFTNHIPDNALSYFTTRTITLFDSAEVFMFLAGYSAALSYYRLAPEGVAAVARKALKRARTIWLYHLGLFVLIMAAAFVLSSRGITTGYEVFLVKIRSEPLIAALSLPVLGFQAPLLDILPMYVVLMLLAPLLIALRMRGETVLLAVSGALWLWASFQVPALPTVTKGVVWNFNPLCWQFLFAVGLVFGWRTRAGAAPIANGSARFMLDAAAIAIVVFSSLILIAIAFKSVDLEAANRLRAVYFSLNKQCLDPRRLVVLLATAYLIARLVPRRAGWLKLRLPQWICSVGAASLPLFSLSIALSFAGKFIVVSAGRIIVADIAVTFTGIAIMLAVGESLRRARQVQAATPAAAEASLAG